MNLRWLGDRLVILREAFAKLRSPKAHNRIFAWLVVRTPAEYFRANHPLAEQMVLARQRMLDDVPEQILALLRVPKERTREYFVQGVLYNSSVSNWAVSLFDRRHGLVEPSIHK